MAKHSDENVENGNQEQLGGPKPSRTFSGIQLVPLLGITFGVIIIIILATRFIFLPFILDNLKDGQKEEQSKKEEVKKLEKGPYAGIDKSLIKYVETGRITTNPLNSAEQFVVVNLGFKFYALNHEALKELFGEKEVEGTMSFPPEFMARIRSKVNQILGSMTVTDLQQKRLDLGNLFRDSLKSVFSSHSLILGEVFLQEFIIQ